MWYMGHGHPILMIDPIKMLSLPQADHAEAHPSCDHICDEWNPFFPFFHEFETHEYLHEFEELTNIGKPMSEMANLGDPSLVGLI